MKSKQLELSEGRVLIGGASGFAEEKDTLPWRFLKQEMPKISEDYRYNIYELSNLDNNRNLIYNSDVDLTIEGFTKLLDGTTFLISNDSELATVKFEYNDQIVFVDKGDSVLISIINGFPKVWYDYNSINTKLTFSGDGVTKEFILDSKPLISEFSLVWVDGKLLIPEEDYSIGILEHKIIFKEAPPSGVNNISVIFDKRNGISIKLPQGYRNGLVISPDSDDNSLLRISEGGIVGSGDRYLSLESERTIRMGYVNEVDGFYETPITQKFYCVFICYNHQIGSFLRIEHSAKPTSGYIAIEDYSLIGMTFIDDSSKFIGIINPYDTDSEIWFEHPINVFEYTQDKIIPVEGQGGYLLSSEDLRLPKGLKVSLKCKIRGATNYLFNNIKLTNLKAPQTSYTYLNLFAPTSASRGQIFERVCDVIPFDTTDGILLNQGNVDTTAEITGVDSAGQITRIDVTKSAQGLTGVDVLIVGDGFGASARGILGVDPNTNQNYLKEISITSPGEQYHIENTGVIIREYGPAASLQNLEISIVAIKAESIK